MQLRIKKNNKRNKMIKLKKNVQRGFSTSVNCYAYQPRIRIHLSEVIFCLSVRENNVNYY